MDQLIDPSEEDCDRDAFREVIGHFMTGVTVITTSLRGRDYGMSASAVSSLSLDPPMLLACLNDLSPTQGAISQTRTFCVNILADDQHELAMRFAQPREDKFAGLAVHRGAFGSPILTDALASLECQVKDDVAGGTHRVFLAAVKRAEAREGSPLAYFRGGFGRLELAANAKAHAALSELVLRRGVPLDEPLEVSALADALELPPSQVYQALLQLEAEGLVARDPERGFLLVPVDCETSDHAFDARCAIEIGVAELTVRRATAAQLAELRRLMDATAGLIVDGRFTDVSAYVAADTALHEHIVSLADNEALLQAYRRLTIPSIMARLFSRFDAASEELIVDHRMLVEAFEQHDLDGVRRVLRSHSEHAKATNNAAILAGGGRL